MNSQDIAEAFQQALAHHRQSRLAEAERLYRAVLAQSPSHFDAPHLLGVIRHQSGDHAGALELIDRAIAINAAVPFVHSNRGLALQGLKRFEDALAAYDRALALQSDLAKTHFNRGNTLEELKRFDEALQSYDRALELKPDYPDALNDRGLILLDQRRSKDAIADFSHALALKPDYAQALCNRGKALLEMGDAAAALTDFDRALAVKPDMPEALNNRASTLYYSKRYLECAASLARLLELNPDFDYARGAMFQAQRCACNWSDFGQTSERIVSDVMEGRRADLPLTFLLHSTSAKVQLHCARNYARDRYPPAAKPLWTNERYRHDRIHCVSIGRSSRSRGRLFDGRNIRAP